MLPCPLSRVSSLNFLWYFHKDDYISISVKTQHAQQFYFTCRFPPELFFFSLNKAEKLSLKMANAVSGKSYLSSIVPVVLITLAGYLFHDLWENFTAKWDPGPTGITGLGETKLDLQKHNWQRNNPVNFQYERVLKSRDDFTFALHDFTSMLLSVTVRDAPWQHSDIGFMFLSYSHGTMEMLICHWFIDFWKVLEIFPVSLVTTLCHLILI